MERFIKQFGRQPAKKYGDNKVEYRGLHELDKVHNQAVNLLAQLEIGGYSIEKTPQLKGFTITFF